MAWRAAPLRMVGSGTGPQSSLQDSRSTFQDILQHVSNGELVIDVEAVSPAEIE